MAKIDCSELVPPTRHRVETACKQFNEKYAVSEEALSELFNRYRSNKDLHYVFLKVVALNCLYGTGIVRESGKRPDVEDVALQIHRIHREIDSALDARPPKIEIVDEIARIARVPVSDSSGKKTRGCFSFVTKYCSWHRPESYPIWDSNVRYYLWCLQKQTDFRRDFKLDGDWEYLTFHGVMVDFRERYDLGPFTFKEIDKFLWLEGERLKNPPSTQA